MKKEKYYAEIEEVKFFQDEVEAKSPEEAKKILNKRIAKEMNWLNMDENYETIRLVELRDGEGNEFIRDD